MIGEAVESGGDQNDHRLKRGKRDGFTDDSAVGSLSQPGFFLLLLTRFAFDTECGNGSDFQSRVRD